MDPPGSSFGTPLHPPEMLGLTGVWWFWSTLRVTISDCNRLFNLFYEREFLHLGYPRNRCTGTKYQIRTKETWQANKWLSSVCCHHYTVHETGAVIAHNTSRNQIPRIFPYGFVISWGTTDLPAVCPILRINDNPSNSSSTPHNSDDTSDESNRFVNFSNSDDKSNKSI